MSSRLRKQPNLNRRILLSCVPRPAPDRSPTRAAPRQATEGRLSHTAPTRDTSPVQHEELAPSLRAERRPVLPGSKAGIESLTSPQARDSMTACAARKPRHAYHRDRLSEGRLGKNHPRTQPRNRVRAPPETRLRHRSRRTGKRLTVGQGSRNRSSRHCPGTAHRPRGHPHDRPRTPRPTRYHRHRSAR